MNNEMLWTVEISVIRLFDPSYCTNGIERAYFQIWKIN